MAGSAEGARITPFLMFTGDAEAAINFYVELFDGEVEHLERYEAGEQEGQVSQAAFRVAGQRIMAFDSPDVHDFGFTPSISLFVDTDDAEETRRLFTGLAEGGQVLMPLDAYPFSPLFGYVTDRFGVAWQVRTA